MLMTVKHEASRTGFIMPAPERMWKVYVVATYGLRVYSKFQCHSPNGCLVTYINSPIS